MVKKKTGGIDSFEMFLQAERVFLSAMLVDDAIWGRVTIEKPLPGQPPLGSPAFILPSQFLHVFTLEIYLKCLTNIRGKTWEQTHNLKKDLFDKLPLKDKNAARTLFLENAKNDSAIQDLTRDFGVNLTLDMVLNSCQGVFQRTRYWFEYKSELYPEVRGRKGTTGTTGLPLAIRVIGKLITDSSAATDFKSRTQKAAQFQIVPGYKSGDEVPKPHGVPISTIAPDGQTVHFKVNKRKKHVLKVPPPPRSTSPSH
jgi:hypothetical protein